MHSCTIQYEIEEYKFSSKIHFPYNFFKILSRDLLLGMATDTLKLPSKKVILMFMTLYG